MLRGFIAAIDVPANGEARFQIPPDCVRFTVRCRTSVALKLAFEPDEVKAAGRQYFSVAADTQHVEDSLHDLSGQTLFIGAASAVVAEIFGWREAGDGRDNA